MQLAFCYASISMDLKSRWVSVLRLWTMIQYDIYHVFRKFFTNYIDMINLIYLFRWLSFEDMQYII